jgi:ATP-dependent helicase/nuclease subunit A
MTRAQRKLVICGATGRVRNDGTEVIPEGCWYQLVKAALIEGESELTVREEADDGAGEVWRYRKQPGHAATPLTHVSVSRTEPQPAWLNREVTADPPRARILTPSSGDEDIAAPPYAAAFDREIALLRGRVLHRLMQSLPDIPEEHRGAAARHYLDRAAREIDEKMRNEIAAQALAIMRDEKFAALFGESSRAEVPIVGRLSHRSQPDVIVSGQVDRLAVTADEVLIADYKTNRPAPRTIEELLARHGSYVRQLAFYRAVLSRIYPGRAVKAALIWTDLPDLMEIPERLLEERLEGLTPA